MVGRTSPIEHSAAASHPLENPHSQCHPQNRKLLQHAGALVCAKREAPLHCSVRQGGGKEAQTDCVRGATREFGEGLSVLWGTAGNSQIVQVSGMGSDGGG